jgi:hypothetical protein
MQNDTVYAITDVNGYVSQMRKAAAQSVSENSNHDNLDNYISIGQMIGLVESHCLGFDANNRPLLNEKQNEIIFHETATMIHNVGLARLAATDLVECSWDDEINEMVFWHKEGTQNDQPKTKRKRKRKNS